MSLVADCFEVLLQTDSGQLMASSTLQSGDIDISCDSKEIKAGRGDALIAILHSGRNATIKLAETTFKWDWIAYNLGTTATTGATTAWEMSKWYTAVDLDGESAGTAIGLILDETPLATDSGLKIYDEDGEEVALTTGYTITGKNVTLVGGIVGDKYEVRGYKYTTASTASTIDISNITFPSGCKCILETLEISEDETELSKVQYIFDEVLPSGNLNLSTKKERDANITNFELKATKPKTSTSLGKVIKIPIA